MVSTLIPRTRAGLFMAAVLAAAAAAAAALPSARPGSPAPSVRLPASHGVFDLDEYRGRLVYIDFWASWCKPCADDFSWLNQMQARYGSKGLQVVAINVDVKRADAERFLSEHPAAFPVAYDARAAVATQYAVQAMPSGVLVGRDGRIIAILAGFHPNQRERSIATALGRN